MIRIEFSGESVLQTLAEITNLSTYVLNSLDVWDAANRLSQKEQGELCALPPVKNPDQAFTESYINRNAHREVVTHYSAKPAAPKPAPPAPKPASKPASKSAEASKPASTPAEPPEEEPSAEMVRAKAMEAARVHGKDKLKAILNELGAANVSAVQDRAAFLRKLEELDNA